MDVPGGLMTMYGLGLFVYLNDRFSQSAARVKAEALTLERTMGGVAVGVSRSAALIGGGVALAAAGLAGLKISSVLAKEAEGVDRFSRALEYHGFGKAQIARIRGDVTGLTTQLGVLRSEGMAAAESAAEYGVREATMLKALRPGFEMAIAMHGDYVKTSKDLLAVTTNLNQSLDSQRAISGKIIIAAEEARSNTADFLSVVRGGSGQMQQYGARLDDVLVNMIALGRTGRDAGENWGNLMQLYKAIQAPMESTRKLMDGTAGAGFRAAVQQGNFGKAIDVLTAKLSKVPPAMRAGVMREIGFIRPGAQEALTALVTYAGERDEWYRSMADAEQRHMKQFEGEFRSWTNQSAMFGRNVRNLFSLMGAGARERQAAEFVGVNRVLGSVLRFADANPKLIAALTKSSYSMSKFAIAAGLASVVTGIVRFRLIQLGVEGAKNLGMLSTLGTGFTTLVSRATPAAAVLLGITGAVKGLQWAYRNNYMGMRDWTDNTIKNASLVGRAVFESFRHVRVEGGKAIAQLPEDLLKELTDRKLLDTARTLMRGAWGAKAFGGEFMSGMRTVMFNPKLMENRKLLLQSIGASLTSLTGQKVSVPDYTTWMRAGHGAGTVAGFALSMLIDSILGATAATLMLAARIKDLYGLFPKPLDEKMMLWDFMKSPGFLMGGLTVGMKAAAAAESVDAAKVKVNAAAAHPWSTMREIDSSILSRLLAGLERIVPGGKGPERQLNLTVPVIIDEHEVGRAFQRIALKNAGAAG